MVFNEFTYNLYIISSLFTFFITIIDLNIEISEYFFISPAHCFIDFGKITNNISMGRGSLINYFGI